jgi:hypothetical protein
MPLVRKEADKSGYFSVQLKILLLKFPLKNNFLTPPKNLGVGAFAKISPSSSSSWAELTLISISPHPPGKIVKLEISSQQVYTSLIAGQGVG